MKLLGTIVLATGAALLAAPTTAAPPAAAKDAKALAKQRDHDAVRRAVLKREVMPLPRILAAIPSYQSGNVLEIELKNKQGRLIYDVDLLVPSGEVRELKIDARSGKLISNQPKGD